MNIANHKTLNVNEHFLSDKEWKQCPYLQVRPIDNCNGIILGQLTKDGSQCIDLYSDPDSPNNPINNNSCVFGSAGSGKTYTYVQNYCYQSIKQGVSVIHTDEKGELFNVLAPVYRHHGYIVRKLNFIVPENSDGWDCLKLIRKAKNIEQMEDLTDTFVGSIIRNSISSKIEDDIVCKTALLLKAVLLLVVLDPNLPEEEKVLKTVYNHLIDGFSHLNILFSDENITETTRPAQSAYEEFHKTLSVDIAERIITSLSIALRKFCYAHIIKLLSTDDIDLELPGDRPCAYFVQLPHPNITYTPPVSLFFSMIFHVLSNKAERENGLNCDVAFMLDNFECCGNVSEIEYHLTHNSNHRNIRINMVFKSIEQMISLYKMSYSSMLNNCSVIILMAFINRETAMYFADRCTNTGTDSKCYKINHVNPDTLQFKLEPNTSVVLLPRHNLILLNNVRHTLHPYALSIFHHSDIYEYKLSDTEKKKKRYQEEVEYSDNYLSTHPKFKPVITNEMQTIGEDGMHEKSYKLLGLFTSLKSFINKNR